jgi:hypothetical protein
MKASSLLAFCALTLLSPRHTLSAPATSIEHEVDTEFSYIGGANTRGGGMDIGSMDEFHTDFKYDYSPQVTKRLLLRVGAEWEWFSFGVTGGAAVPDHLHKLSANFGFDYAIKDQWLLHTEVQPGIYTDFADVTWRDVDAPFVLTAAYVVDADLQWFLGLRADVRSRYPVLPVLGVRWKFADDWTLRLILPEPRLEYELTDHLNAYFGVGIKAGTFTVGEDFGTDHGRPDLNNAAMDYVEVRVGPGLAWSIRPDMTLEADAGYMVFRRFDYVDKHLIFRSDPAPYAQLAFRVRF